MSATTVRRPTAPTQGTATVVLHGRHALRGYPVTWHIAPVPVPGSHLFVVERADGHLGEDAWALAEKESEILTAGEVRELLSRVGTRTA